MPQPTIRAVLTGLGGVTRDWPGQDDAAIERKHGLPRPVVTGLVTDAEWRWLAIEALMERHPGAAMRSHRSVAGIGTTDDAPS